MRERLTWKRGGALNAPPRRASAHPAYPDEGAASPAYQPDPEADAYENGDTSAWAEDPNPGPYPQSAHPAYPDEGPASPAYIAKQGSVALALERKAAKCVRLASAMLGPTASQHEVESQAFAFMDMSERALQASLSRLAQQDEEEEQDAEEQQEKEAKKAALRRRAQQAKKDAEEQDAEDEGTEEEQQEVKGGKKAALAKAAYLRRLAQQIEEEVEEEDDDSDEDEDEEQQEKGAKKASVLDARLARIERLLTAGVPGMFMQHNMAQQKSPEEAMLEAMLGEAMQDEAMQDEDMDDEAQSLEEMLLEEMQDEAQQAPKPFGMMAEQLAMQGDNAGPMIESMRHNMAQQAPVEAQLAEMLQEEGMAGVLGAEYADEAEAMLVDPSGDDYIGADGMLVDPSGDNYDDGMVADPMGLMGDGGNEDDAILASLFGGEAMKYAKKGQQGHPDAEEQEEEQEADEPKKGQQKAAALRPQPRKASTGATRLGGITKEAAEVSDLSKLWESAPDVSKYF